MFGIDDLAAATLGSAVIGGIGSLFGQKSANDTNIMLAEQNRQWQSEENQKNRDFQTDMWNKQNEYNTPANQMKLLREAGLNPMMYSVDGSTSGAGSSGVPSMVGAPSQAHVAPLDYGSVINPALQLLQNGLQVEANQEEQHTKAISNMVRVAIDAYKELGYKGYKDVMDAFSPILANIDFQGSRADVVFNNQLQNWLSERYNMDMDSLNKEITYDLGKKYGEQQIQSNLEKLQYDISEIVGRLNTMSVQNEATIRQTAADIVVKAAHAFMLRKQGEKFAADAKTANDMLEWLVKSVKHEAEIKGVQSYFSLAKQAQYSDLVGYLTSGEGRDRTMKSGKISLEQQSSDLLRAMDKVFGEYVSINSSSVNVQSSGYSQHENVTPIAPRTSVVGF